MLIPPVEIIVNELQIASQIGIPASIYNIIPLIPQHELKDYAAPTCPQIDEARIKASKYIDVFRHCQHCRADAVGVPGKSEFGDQIYQRRLNVKETFSHG